MHAPTWFHMSTTDLLSTIACPQFHPYKYPSNQPYNTTHQYKKGKIKRKKKKFKSPFFEKTLDQIKLWPPHHLSSFYPSTSCSLP